MMVYEVAVYMNNGNNNSHLNYPAINVEWVLNNSGHTLCSYMGNVLDIKNKDTGRDLLRYAGMLDYYVRNEYGYEYKSSRDVHGIMAGRHMMDPWNREFLVFPGDMSSNVGKYSYERYYSGVVYKTVYHNEFKGGDNNYIRHNVMLLTTTVNGSVVYCLDILAGIYDHF